MWVYFTLCQQSTLKSQNSGASCIGGFGQTDGQRKFELGIPPSWVRLILEVHLMLETRQYQRYESEKLLIQDFSCNSQANELTSLWVASCCFFQSILHNSHPWELIFIYTNRTGQLTHWLAPGKFEWNFRYAIIKWILVIAGRGISCEIALIWISLDFTDDQSTLVQVMTWCRQATSQYLSQCWPRSLSPYGVTRPQWVNQYFPHPYFCESCSSWSFHKISSSVLLKNNSRSFL